MVCDACNSLIPEENIHAHFYECSRCKGFFYKHRLSMYKPSDLCFHMDMLMFVRAISKPVYTNSVSHSMYILGDFIDMFTNTKSLDSDTKTSIKTVFRVLLHSSKAKKALTLEDFEVFKAYFTSLITDRELLLRFIDFCFGVSVDQYIESKVNNRGSFLDQALIDWHKSV